MFCAKCGTQNDDNAVYCHNCGAVLRPQGGAGGPSGGAAGGRGPAVGAGGSRQAGGYMPYGGAGAGFAPGNAAAAAEGSQTRALRELILTPLFLVAAIALSSQVILGILAAIAGAAPYAAMIQNIINETGMYEYSEYSYQLSHALSSGNVFSAIVSNAPSVMIAVGLWLQYSYARKRDQKMGTTGFTMIRIILIIQLVGICIGLALAVIGSLIGMVAAGRYDEGGKVIAVIVLVVVLIALFGALVILYYFKILKMLDSAISIISHGIRTAQASMYVIIFTFISGGLSCLSALGSLTISPFAFLTTAASAASSIAFGLLMLEYNKMTPRVSDDRNVVHPYDLDVPPAPPVNAGGGPVQDHIPAAPGGISPSQSPVPAVPKDIPYYNIPPKPGTVVINWEEDQKKRQFAQEGTVVLNEEVFMPPAKLVRAGDQKEVKITKPEFTIGKAYGSVDYFIDNNPAISRRHARIVLQDGKYYIIDTNSTNHVYVDGRLIPVETPVPLADGNMIRLADEVYTFRETD